MKRISLPALAALFFSASPIFAASTLTVYVVDQNGNPLPSVQVVALNFGNNGPTQDTRMANAAAGVATFSPANSNSLVDNDFYQIVASSQGYAPSIATQLSNGPLGITANPAAPVVSTITLSYVGGFGEIDAAVSNTSPNSILFGQVGLQSGGSPVAFGAAPINGSGSGTMHIYNVPFAPANTYNISAFDNQKNSAASTPVNQDLGTGATWSGQSFLSSFALNFSNGIPPAASAGQQSGGNVSATGVVTDTNSVVITGSNLFVNFSGQIPSPYAGGQPTNDNRGAPVNQNGSFQLYGLNPGTTYYASISGGCSNTGVCYQGFQDNGPGRGSFDAFVPDTSTVISLSTGLAQMNGGSLSMAVQIYINVNGSTIPMPQSGLSISPDFTSWSTTTNHCWNGTGMSPPNNPGFANINAQTTTGYYLATGLMPGNYMVNANSQFGGYTVNLGTGSANAASNAPPSASTWSSFGRCGSGDLRVTIATVTPTGAAITDGNNVLVFDASAHLISRSSTMTIIVPLVNQNLGGSVQGTLNFPGQVNLSQDPITISLNAQCSSMNCPPGGFYELSSNGTGPAVNYSIPVSTGYSYWMNVNANYWGALFAGGNQPQPNVTSTTPVVTVNLTFAPAGRILGNLYKPDGSVYIVPQNSNNGGNSAPAVNAQANSAYGQVQINSDGSFILGGLLPDVYQMSAQSFGSASFPYTVAQPLPSVTVTAGKDSAQDVHLVNAVSVQPVASTTTLPSLSIYNCGGNTNQCPPEDWRVLSLPQGKPWTTATTMPFLNSDAPGTFEYAPSANASNNMCNGNPLKQAGFCYESMPANSVAGTSYDFYLVRRAQFDARGLAGGARPYMVIERTLPNQTIKQSLATVSLYNPNSMSTATLQQVNFSNTPDLSTGQAAQEAVLAGTVTISNVFTPNEFTALGGDFNNFLLYLPLAWLYDSSSTLKAVGMVVPSPLAEAQVDTVLRQAVGSGNLSTFQALMSTSNPNGWGAVGFEIRGLTANTTYNMVVTTPNYPPFKETVYTGAAGSTTSWNVNMDANPGVTLSGVVQSTSTPPVGIANAAVTVQAPGYAATSVNTASAPVAGAWQLSGLGSGVYSLSVTAAGYALGAQTVDVGGSNVTAPPFSLTASNSAIRGRVYTTQPICKANDPSCVPWVQTNLSGATVLAYDETMNINSPASVLPLYHGITNSTGMYELDGLLAGDTYQIYVNAHGPDGRGYYVASQSTLAVAGLLTGMDFQLLPKPLTVNVYGHPTSTNYEFLITNYTEFSSGKAWYNNTSPFTKTNSTDVSSGFMPTPGGLVLDIPLAKLTAGETYILHIEAQPNNPGSPLVIKELPFGLGLPNNACQNVDETLLGNDSDLTAQGLPLNQSPLDITGANGSGLTMPAGAVMPLLSTAVPTMCMSAVSVTTAPVFSSQALGPQAPRVVFAPRAGAVSVTNTAAFASNIYQVSLSSVNYTGKGINLTFAYNQSGADLTDLAIFSYSTTTAQWTPVSGVQTIDPVRGTISISGAQSLSSPQSLAQTSSLRAQNTGGRYHANASAASSLIADDAGLFAVMRPSVVSTGTAASSVASFKIYNFPNPFNLSVKTVQLQTTASCTPSQPSLSTNGTVIKYEVPATVTGGHAVLRIYTTSGRLVREVDQGDIAPGACYYTAWDGANRQGSMVANGIYYGILSLPGVSSRDGTFKMAVIK
jgi:hypothetical protein